MTTKRPTDPVRACRVLGLLSGTSMDGIDVAAADIALRGGTIELTPLGCAAIPYPEALRADLLGALPPRDCSAETLCRLDNGVGQSFAEAAARGVAELAEGQADLIASLGQTIYHWVDDGRCRGTLQLGQPAWIAERTGLPVVADLRVRDVAAGGHGAPLAGLFDTLWLTGLADGADPPDSDLPDSDLPDAGLPDARSGRAAGARVALNLGGIANITVVRPDSPPLAFDTGPANALLDAACLRTGRRQDTGGRLALAGTVRADLLDLLLADPYFAAPAPKSTGKEHFSSAYLAAALDRITPITDADLLATLVEVTARSVADACHAHDAVEVIAAGGGVHNAALLAALSRRLAPARLATSDAHGVPVDGKEAYLTAVLGALSWFGVPGNLPAATGAAGPRVLGAITPGATPLRLPEPATEPIVRLRITAPRPAAATDPAEPADPETCPSVRSAGGARANS